MGSRPDAVPLNLLEDLETGEWMKQRWWMLDPSEVVVLWLGRTTWARGVGSPFVTVALNPGTGHQESV